TRASFYDSCNIQFRTRSKHCFEPCIPPPRDDWDRLFQPMFDEYFTPLSIAVSPVQEADALRVVVLAESHVSTSIDQDAPSTKAQEARQILDEEKLAFLADPGVLDGQAIQTIIPNNVAFQTEDLDTYDFDCYDILNAKVVLMANISNYGSDVISEVPH
nr:hypothetical protein [Tanacetum cinerariifolium]